MNRFTRFAIRSPVTVAMVSLASLVLAALAVRGMPVSLLPDVKLGVLTLTTAWPGAPAQAVETSVGRPLEEALAGTPGLEDLEILSLDGLCRCTLRFALGTSVDAAAMAVGDRLDRVRNALPQEAERTQVRRFDPSERPVMRCFAAAEAMGERGLRRYLMHHVVRDLERIPGVAAVDISGGCEPEVKVDLSLMALKAHHLTPLEIQERLVAAAEIIPAGEWVRDGKAIPVKTGRMISDLEGLSSIPVGPPGTVSIPLSRVATVREAWGDPLAMASRDGRPGIWIDIHKTPGFDTGELSGLLRRAVAEANHREKGRLSIAITRDDRIQIHESLRHLISDGILGGLCALFILALLMRHPFLPVALALVLPFSFAVALTALYLGGIRLHALTLTGFAVAVGLMLDNAIITLDAILERRRMGETWEGAAVSGPRQVSLSVVAASGGTLIVFVPLLFLKGLLGAFFTDLAWAIIAAVSASVLVSLVLLPTALSRPAVGRALGWVDGRPLVFLEWSRKPWEALESGYGWILRAVLSRRRATLAVIPVALGVTTTALVWTLDLRLVPETPSRHLTARLEFPPGTRLEVSHGRASALGESLGKEPGVKGVALLTGMAAEPWSGPWEAQGSHGASFSIEAEDITAAMRLRRDLNGRPPPIGGHFSVSFEKEAILSWLDDGAPVWRLHGDARDRIETVLADFRRGLSSTSSGAVLHSDEDLIRETLQLELNPEALGRSALAPDETARNLRALVAGLGAGDVVSGGWATPIRLGLSEMERNLLAPGELPAMSRGRPAVALSSVASPKAVRSPRVLRRHNHGAYVQVSMAGVDGATAKALMEAWAKTLPRDLHLSRGPEVRRQNQALLELALAFALALVFLYLFLGTQMASFTAPFPVLLSIPPVFVGAALALKIGGHGLSLWSGLGLLLLAGAIVREGVILTERLGTLPTGPHIIEDFISCARSRLRPVVATASAAVLALMPLALGLGEGTAMQAPLALAMVGGLLTGTAVTLLFLPAVLYRTTPLNRSIPGVQSTKSPNPFGDGAPA